MEGQAHPVHGGLEHAEKGPLPEPLVELRRVVRGPELGGEDPDAGALESPSSNRGVGPGPAWGRGNLTRRGQ